MKKYIVTLTKDERKTLRTLVSTGHPIMYDYEYRHGRNSETIKM